MKVPENIELRSLAIHKVGTKSQPEQLILAKSSYPLQDPLTNEILKKYFFYAFKEDEYYHFHHPENLDQHQVFSLVSPIFQDPEQLYIQSVKLAQYLFEQSDHPNIKFGEFYVVYFEDCQLEDEVCDVVGIFKSENKDTFLKIYQQEDQFAIERDQGLNIYRMDKGCLIFNTEQEMGYKLAIVDKTNKNQEAHYWKDDFLQVKEREDNFYNTRNYIKMCHDFVHEAMPEADKVDQIDLIHNSANYFKENDSFEKVAFQEKVLQRPEIIEAFEDFQQDYHQKNQFQTPEEFEIAPSAVKKLKNVFKSVIKLDKNFHIYVHGNKEMIKKGFDDKTGMNFYQLFYQDES